jgi:hypothetical protein
MSISLVVWPDHFRPSLAGTDWPHGLSQISRMADVTRVLFRYTERIVSSPIGLGAGLGRGTHPAPLPCLLRRDGVAGHVPAMTLP